MAPTFRVTHHSIGTRALANLQTNLDKMGTLQAQLSSGKLISRASDDPSGAASAMSFRAEIKANAQYSRNADDGIGWLGTQDSALTDALTQLNKVRDLVVQGMNTGGNDPLSRGAMAVEVGQLRDGVLGNANATYLGRPVFGGTTTGTIAFDASGTYVGDANPVLRTVGDGAVVQVDTAGSAVFGAGPTQLFSVLADIGNHLAADPASLDTDLARLDTTMKNMREKLSDVGARYSRVESMRQAADDRVLTLKSSLSGVEDVDLPKAIVEMQMQQAAYQAALGATSRVIQPSLMDFLR